MRPPFPYDNYPNADFLAHPQPPLNDRSFLLIREGLLLNEDAYRTLRHHATPMGRGALVLFWIVLVAGVAQGMGLALGLLTSPRLDIIQSTIYDSITSLNWFVIQAAASPDFAQQFNQAYATAWQGIRIAGGYPSWSSTLATVASVIAGTYLNWLVYGFLAHWTARWFGGSAGYAQFMGPLALSYAPLILTVVMLAPGASVAAPFLFLALLACKYVAVKTMSFNNC